MTRPGIELRSPGPLANNLPTWPMSRSIRIFLVRLTNFFPVGDRYRTRRRLSCTGRSSKWRGQEDHNLSSNQTANRQTVNLDFSHNLPISLLNSSTSTLLVTSTLTTSAYAVYLATSSEPSNVRGRRTGFAFNLHRKGSSARMYRIGYNGHLWRIDRVKIKVSAFNPFTSSITLGDA